MTELLRRAIAESDEQLSGDHNSVRISTNYRTRGLMESGQIYWFWIGVDSEYNELLRRL
ncbi:hypothetical protein [Chroogloeocystis siderophila]|jgi:hypothetical protein|uniref:hypothetical protein n=1 Tax=Chroogloeocystis siderophila TaxID=329163 RepID=UPI0015C1B4ED|nr:hypothetical protein [Chroogloeocystis siderophila]